MLQSALAQMKAQGKTIILTTHDFTFGLELCTRVFIVDRGRIAWESAGHVLAVQEFMELYHVKTQSSVLSPQSS